MADITNQAEWAIYACTMSTDSQAYATAWVSWRKGLLDDDSADPAGLRPMATLPPEPAGGMPMRGIIHRFNNYIKRVKSSANYTPAVGDQLRINPPVPAPVDPSAAQPVLTAAAAAMFQAQVRWTRQGFGALELQSQRDGEADWTSLGARTTGEHVDARPPAVAGKPEVRRYRAIFLLDDAPVGLWSAVVSVTVHP